MGSATGGYPMIATTVKEKKEAGRKFEEEDQVREPIRKESDKLIFTMLCAR
jgi:hypothetical protein